MRAGPKRPTRVPAARGRLRKRTGVTRHAWRAAQSADETAVRMSLKHGRGVGQSKDGGGGACGAKKRAQEGTKKARAVAQIFL
ncbi:hypothetical protein WT08_08065 [Burkholderia sp. MSMB1552]|nr:hypothetical protein AQ610_04330 [Burkholderia humptydooensis]ATF36061.1 hypothetical protein CO709_23775 [Burkholderia thailandensis]KST73457.1 hypothetical protein WS76_04240 [Burkholderia humptydooensis]KVN14136.1 hypothetical protein WT08_08065 [Burkholderia sp. MSMB1552]KWZ56759.1 hypothetical protein WS92_13255 [Burkholderia sp. MSMB1588]